MREFILDLTVRLEIATQAIFMTICVDKYNKPINNYENYIFSLDEYHQMVCENNIFKICT